MIGLKGNTAAAKTKNSKHCKCYNSALQETCLTCSTVGGNFVLF